MKVIGHRAFFEAAYELVKRSCVGISPDARKALKEAYAKERNEAARAMLETMIGNAELATTENIPVCQSPGYPVVYAKLGNTIQLESEIQPVFQKALVKATKASYLRPSIVHPITRKNLGDNSGVGVPDVEVEYSPEMDYMEFIISFKGCGAELANVLKILTPTQVGSDGAGIKQLVLRSVVNAGGIPCPPVGIGVGIGGQGHYSAKLSRKVLAVRNWTQNSAIPELAILEKELLDAVNSLGIGPAGIGGDTTALTVMLEMVDTHVAICPVAVNFHCWTARRAGIRFYSDGSTVKLFGD